MKLSCNGRFKWIDPTKFNLYKYNDSSSRGYALEVNFEHLKELHKLRNDYPLILNKLKVKRKMVSYHQLKFAENYDVSVGNVKRLVPTFLRKKSTRFIIKISSFI